MDGDPGMYYPLNDDAPLPPNGNPQTSTPKYPRNLVAELARVETELAGLAMTPDNARFYALWGARQALLWATLGMASAPSQGCLSWPVGSALQPDEVNADVGLIIQRYGLVPDEPPTP